MKIVIDIPEELYKEYTSINLGRGNGKTITYNLLKAIKNGTPLPEHHGRLIDADDLLTDTEQRIFLKAMSREREICQKVDDEYSDDDSKVSLVKVCDSIKRKVKKIWE